MDGFWLFFAQVKYVAKVLLHLVAMALGIARDEEATYNQVPFTNRFHVDFDASRNNQVMRLEFRITKKRDYYTENLIPYYVSLGIIPTEKISNDALRALIDTNNITISKDEKDMSNPTIINDDLLMRRCGCSFKEANKIYWDGIRDGSFIYRPLDRAGIVPLWIDVKKIDEDPVKTIVSGEFEALDSIRYWDFGADKARGLDRKITSYFKLDPGSYSLEVKTLQDTPALFDAKFKIGISYLAYK